MKRHTEEFKRAAVQRTLDGETPIAVSRDLKLSGTGTIYQWRAKYAAELSPGTAPAKSAAKGPVVAVRKGPKGRAIYPLELKLRAVSLVKSGTTPTAAAEQLDVPVALIRRWSKHGVKSGANGETRGNGFQVITVDPPQQVVVTPAPAPRKPRSAVSPADSRLYLQHAERELIALIREHKVETISEDRALMILALRAQEKAG